MTIQQDILIQQGATTSITWQLLNKNASTGYTFSAKLRGQHASSTALLTLSSFTAVHDGNHTDVTATITSAASAALSAPMMGVYDMESTLTATGAVTREAEGSFYITPEATK